MPPVLLCCAVLQSFFKGTAKTPSKPPGVTVDGLAASTPAEAAPAEASTTPAGVTVARAAAVPTPATGHIAANGGAPANAVSGAVLTTVASGPAPAYATPHVHVGGGPASGRIRHVYGGHLALVASRAAAEGLTLEQWVEQQREALDRVWEGRPGESEPVGPYVESLRQRWRSAAVKERQPIKGE
jgi:hypothetical protein